MRHPGNEDVQVEKLEEEKCQDKIEPIKSTLKGFVSCQGTFWCEAMQLNAMVCLEIGSIFDVQEDNKLVGPIGLHFFPQEDHCLIIVPPRKQQAVLGFVDLRDQKNNRLFSHGSWVEIVYHCNTRIEIHADIPEQNQTWKYTHNSKAPFTVVPDDECLRPLASRSKRALAHLYQKDRFIKLLRPYSIACDDTDEPIKIRDSATGRILFKIPFVRSLKTVSPQWHHHQYAGLLPLQSRNEEFAVYSCTERKLIKKKCSATDGKRLKFFRSPPELFNRSKFCYIFEERLVGDYISGIIRACPRQELPSWGEQWNLPHVDGVRTLCSGKQICYGPLRIEKTVHEIKFPPDFTGIWAYEPLNRRLNWGILIDSEASMGLIDLESNSLIPAGMKVRSAGEHKQSGIENGRFTFNARQFGYLTKVKSSAHRWYVALHVFNLEAHNQIKRCIMLTFEAESKSSAFKNTYFNAVARETTTIKKIAFEYGKSVIQVVCRPKDESIKDTIKGISAIRALSPSHVLITYEDSITKHPTECLATLDESNGTFDVTYGTRPSFNIGGSNGELFWGTSKEEKANCLLLAPVTAFAKVVEYPLPEISIQAAVSLEGKPNLIAILCVDKTDGSQSIRMFDLDSRSLLPRRIEVKDMHFLTIKPIPEAGCLLCCHWDYFAVLDIQPLIL
jgi:hypothetical protein